MKVNKNVPFVEVDVSKSLNFLVIGAQEEAEKNKNKGAFLSP